jgi:hypothetical protein
MPYWGQLLSDIGGLLFLFSKVLLIKLNKKQNSEQMPFLFSPFCSRLVFWKLSKWKKCASWRGWPKKWKWFHVKPLKTCGGRK